MEKQRSVSEIMRGGNMSSAAWTWIMRSDTSRKTVIAGRGCGKKDGFISYREYYTNSEKEK